MGRSWSDENPDIEISAAETRTRLEQAAMKRRGVASRVVLGRLLLENATKNALRRERLYQEGAVSLSEMEDAKLAADRLKEALTEARSVEKAAVALESGLRRTLSELQVKREELVVKSPIKGVVLDLPAEKDKVFQPGDLVVAVAPRARIEVASDVLSDALGGVAVGQGARVTAPILGSTVLEGRVSKIYPQAEEILSPPSGLCSGGCGLRSIFPLPRSSSRVSRSGWRLRRPAIPVSISCRWKPSERRRKGIAWS